MWRRQSFPKLKDVQNLWFVILPKRHARESHLFQTALLHSVTCPAFWYSASSIVSFLFQEDDSSQSTSVQSVGPVLPNLLLSCQLWQAPAHSAQNQTVGRTAQVAWFLLNGACQWANLALNSKAQSMFIASALAMPESCWCCLTGGWGLKNPQRGPLFSSIFDNSRKNDDQAPFVTFAPRLYNPYNHANAQGRTCGRVRAPGRAGPTPSAPKQCKSDVHVQS